MLGIGSVEFGGLCWGATKAGGSNMLTPGLTGHGRQPGNDNTIGVIARQWTKGLTQIMSSNMNGQKVGTLVVPILQEKKLIQVLAYPRVSQTPKPFTYPSYR